MTAQTRNNIIIACLLIVMLAMIILAVYGLHADAAELVSRYKTHSIILHV